MSMLSTQIDELRELATRYDELQVGVVRAVRVPLNMGSVLRKAADTIWQLRDDLQRAHRENDKLLELMRGLHMAYVETLNECESLDEGLIWECSGDIDADVAKSRAKFKADRHRFDAALRELGVEVD